MKEKFRRVRYWRFTVESCGGPWTFPPERINDCYLNGFFIFRLFVGWMR